ncbi:uncharacterized protein LOC120624524 [Pararge aegeria]|uniref:uncharacterized protein LOC120624524 n=1 Tax=Pararge aegeria TaxID=116150 RepID=UPI0019D15F33|nr:uncharacterized protein LOC120624524 [Pararge aegeria]
MKKILRKLRERITFKDLPPPYRENEVEAIQRENFQQQIPDPPSCDALDLLANCKITSEPNDSDTQSEVEYAEIEDMGVWHSTPLSHRHKSKISLTWVLKENTDKADRKKEEKIKAFSYDKPVSKCFDNKYVAKDRVAGRNEYYHNLRFKSACEVFANHQDSCSDSSVGTEEFVRRKHRHRHRRRKRNSKFGYDIRDLDTFLTEATIDHPGNIPVVIAFPTTLYQTQKDLQRELTLPLGTVLNAVFKNQQWLYAQTPHGDEGYVLYSACLPLGILPSRSSLQKKTPCWESSTDIYPRPCSNLTDSEKEHLRGRTRSESRHRPRTRQTKTTCAEKDFDSLYLKTKSVCSNLDSGYKDSSVDFKPKLQRQTLLVVNCDYNGSFLNRTLSVKKGEVVVLIQGGGETDVDLEWFYVRRKDGNQGFIPAAIAGHGYI